jgi:uncharacterized PurR-regulated membrane protein YhhQ (DUF165 family)
MDGVPLLKIALVSAVVMGISHTIAMEKIFHPLRRRLGGMHTWLGQLVSCPYCVSHWIAFVLVPITGAYGVRIEPRWPVVAPFLDWFLSCILVTVLAAFLRVGFYFIDVGQKLSKTEMKIAEKQAEIVEKEAEQRLQ